MFHLTFEERKSKLNCLVKVSKYTRDKLDLSVIKYTREKLDLSVIKYTREKLDLSLSTLGLNLTCQSLSTLKFSDLSDFNERTENFMIIIYQKLMVY